MSNSIDPKTPALDICLITLSAADPQRLIDKILALQQWLPSQTNTPLVEIAASLLAADKKDKERIVFIAHSVKELEELLKLKSQNHKHEQIIQTKLASLSHQQSTPANFIENLFKALNAGSLEPASYKRKLSALAELFVNGTEIEWQQLTIYKNINPVILPSAITMNNAVKSTVKSDAARQLSQLEWEDWLIKRFSEILKQPINKDDNLFDLGVESFIAIQFINEIRLYTKNENIISTKEVYDLQTIAKLAEYLSKVPSINAASSTHHQGKEKIYPASICQQNLWLLYQGNPGSLAYLTHIVKNITSGFDIDILNQALNHVITQHEPLRTYFQVFNQSLIQFVCPSLTVQIEETLSHNQAMVVNKVSEMIQPFDLSKPPLFRAKLIKLNNNESLFAMAFSHFICDGVSCNVLINEITKQYFAIKQLSQIPTLPITFETYTFSQYENYQTYLPQELQYHTHVYQQITPLLDKIPSQAALSSGDYHAATLDSDLTKAVKSFHKQHNISGYAFFMAIYAALITATHKRNQLTLLAVRSGRNQSGTESLIAYLADGLPLHISVNNNLNLIAYLKDIQKNLVLALDNNPIPLAFSDLSKTGFVPPPVTYNYYQADPDTALFATPEQDPRDSIIAQLGRIPFWNYINPEGLIFMVRESENHFSFNTIYRDDLYTKDEVKLITDGFILMLRKIVNEPGGTLLQFYPESLPTLSANKNPK